MRKAVLLAAACSVVASQAQLTDFDLGPAVNGFGLNGQNEVPLPSTPSPAQGKVSPLGSTGIRYDADFDTLELHFGWGAVTDVDGVNLTAPFSGMHIHGPAGTSGSATILYDLIAEDNADITQAGYTPGDPLRPLAPDDMSGFFDFILTLREGVGGLTINQQEQALLGNQWYINIHSTGTYSAGEIRGQLLAVPEPEHYAAMAGLALLGFAGYRRFKVARA